MTCLAAMGHTLVADSRESDLVIMHEEPFRYSSTMAAKPVRFGGKYVGYAVWETPELPAAFVEGVSRPDAIWTCSEFSRNAFAPHARTFVLPHVVERLRPAAHDMDWMAARLGITELRREARDILYFYTIVDTVNPRKNIETLLAAFAMAFPGEEEKVRLVVKQYREPQNLNQFSHVIDIPEMLSSGQLAALHAVCDCYVSAHHAEAWGLPLSEAMAIGNPVIATGYSGNMEFMDAKNSFPAAYTVHTVSENMCRALPNLFSPEMTWANIDVPDLVRLLRHVRTRLPGPDFRSQTVSSMRRFSPEGIQKRLTVLLESV